ncbi:MAG: DUF5331 domain-containing protein [Heteroscytonema crispum UTEX LB 1556]
MNIQQLRESLKIKWLNYYEQNRPWLVKMRIWGTYDSERRPSSGFILATLSLLEPLLEQVFPFILELNNNPDRIVAALGLNFNPDEELRLIKLDKAIAITDATTSVESNENSLADDAVNTEVYNNGKPVPSDAAPTELDREPAVVPTKVYSDRKSVPLVAVSSKTHSTGLPMLSLAVPIKAYSDRNAVPLVAVSRGFQNQSKVGRSLAVPSLKQSNSKPVSSIPAPTQRQGKNKPVSSVTVPTQTQGDGKILKKLYKNVPGEIRPFSSSNASNLPSWIDEFCQGAACDRDDAIFTHF